MILGFLSTEQTDNGFSLLELMVGIAVSSLLLLALFELLSDLSILRSKYFEKSVASHRKAVLSRFLHEDLGGIPKSDIEFKGRRREFFRTTVTHDLEKGYRLESRVHYFIRNRGSEQSLHREIKWVDLQKNFGNERELLRASQLSFSYQTTENKRIRNTSGSKDETQAINLHIGQETLTFALSTRSSKDDKSEKVSPGT